MTWPGGWGLVPGEGAAGGAPAPSGASSPGGAAGGALGGAACRRLGRWRAGVGRVELGLSGELSVAKPVVGGGLRR